MCIIVAKKANVPMPDRTTLKNCWDTNPDGAGIMYAHGSKVHVEKGIMTWADFEACLDRLGKQHDMQALSLVMHFRISTQAGVNPENTHPFPITRDPRALTAPRSESTLGAVAHNGIIDCCCKRSKKEKFSDTYYFVRDYAAYLIDRPGTVKKKWMQRILEEIARSKLAFLLPDGGQVLIGQFIEDKGVSYSNDTYKDFGYGYGWQEDLYLYACTEDMCFYDEELGDYYPCDPDYHLYDDFAELWVYDADTGEAYPLGYDVLDCDLLPVRPPKKNKGRLFTCGDSGTGSTSGTSDTGDTSSATSASNTAA